MDMIEKARIFGLAAHTAVGQVRKYSGDHYWIHPLQVSQLTSSLKNSTPEMIIAALLHDVVEDTHITLDLIKQEFGDVVGRYVDGLTDVSKLSDGNRKVRKLMDLAHTAAQGYEVQTIKCFDIRNNDRSITLSEDGFKYVWKEEKRQLREMLTRADPIALKLLDQPLNWSHEDDVLFLRKISEDTIDMSLETKANKCKKDFFAEIGITGIDNADWPLFEDNYIKFMSFGGTTDDAQGDMFKVWLDSKGFTYERNRGRSFRNLDATAVAEISRIYDKYV